MVEEDQNNINSDDAQKIVNELIVHERSNEVPKKQENQEPTESIDGVPAKDPPKVKSVKE